ncbi:MAG: TusE/DsrC/DsvC family sulfur relay protein [bacterium]
MDMFFYNNKSYEVDSYGFLVNSSAWDENFAAGIALELNIQGGLKVEHWKIINYIRDIYKKTNICPVVYETCKNNNLTLYELKELFPAGYQRGACRIAGITYREGFLRYNLSDSHQSTVASVKDDKTYTIDKYGFLINPNEWDKNFVVLKASELKMSALNGNHWKIILYLREKFESTKKIPTIYETCEDNNIDFDEFSRLFPDGYHRGAVKLSGLCLF